MGNVELSVQLIVNVSYSLLRDSVNGSEDDRLAMQFLELSYQRSTSRRRYLALR
jgi:hypothetical protein